MTTEHAPIVIESCSIDEHNGTTILRGVITIESLDNLLVDDYQREELTAKQRESIEEALKKGEPLPDLEIGMRGENFREVRKGRVHLKDPTYIIDGLQRRQTVTRYLIDNPTANVRLGVKVYLNTTKQWEKNRFHVLNAKRAKVSPNVLMRNMREESVGINMIWGLTKNERQFVMHNRVQWSQGRMHGELTTALTFGRAATRLHAHKIGTASSLEETACILDRGAEVIGIQNMRENLRSFWGLIDECWGIRKVTRHGSAPYLKGNFIDVFSKILSDHYDFWGDECEKKLFVHAPLRRKIAQFNVDDNEVARLCGSGGKAREILYILLRDHINSGKRTKRIKSRHGDAVQMETEVMDEENEDASAA